MQRSKRPLLLRLHLRMKTMLTSECRADGCSGAQSALSTTRHRRCRQCCWPDGPGACSDPGAGCSHGSELAD